MIGFNWTKGPSTFRARIFWSVIPTILILFALVGAINLRQHKRLVEEQFMKRGQVVASNLAYSSQLGVFAEDKPLLASSIRGVVGDPDVAYVYIYGEDGKILAKGGRQVSELTELNEELAAEAKAHLVPDREPVSRSVTVAGKRFVEFFAPILSEEGKLPDELLIGPLTKVPDQLQPERQRQIGTIRLGLSLHTVVAHTLALLRLWGGLTVVFFGLSALAIYICSRRITRTIKQLTEKAAEIAAGRRSGRVEIDSRDEIGRLANSFNEMAASLEQHEAALQRKVVETETLYEISQEITAQVALEPTLRLIVERARDLSRAEVSLLALRQGESETFAFEAYSGTESQTLLEARFHPGEGLSGQVVMTGTPMMVNDYLEEFRTSPFLDAVKKVGVRAIVAVPLKARGKVIGVLIVTSRVPHKFREEDQQLLSALADHAAIAIENAKLYEQVRQYAEALEAKVESRTQELQETNRRLEEASRHKSEFLANMSHELRTPMNAIMGFTRLVMRRAKELLPARDYENLGKILISAEHLLALINDILDLSKIEAGRMEVHSISVDLEPLVDVCLRTVEPLVKSERIRLVKAIEPGLPPLSTDQDKLKQVLINLLSNAVKFTEEGTVTVNARRRAGKVEIAIADTGIGIPADKLELIFEEFRQVDSSTTRKYSGTGLGLSISRHLARLLGGDIAVQSTVGVGSTFTLTLPLQYEASALASYAGAMAAQEEPSVSPEADKVILAIDDDPDVIYLLSENLAESGYRVVGALDGAEGLQKARELRPQVITLDILMPHKDGWQILHELKADPATRDIPIIVLSIVDNKDLGYRLGASDYLLKPFDREAILSALARFDPLHRGRLLVVDDDPRVVDLVRQLLEDEPYEVIAATDGQEALEAIAQTPPDVILLDLLMPRMDGFTVIEHLQRDPQGRHIPVIVLTAKTLTAVEQAVLDQSVRTVIQKRGLERDALIQELRGLLQAYRGPTPKG
ncbi:MAG TPA: response regulator [Candidatus Tectomicrobia bacterium]|nr:response regulator [Candidatus Tectomicrobia bacterium]